MRCDCGKTTEKKRFLFEMNNNKKLETEVFACDDCSILYLEQEDYEVVNADE